MTPGGSRPRHSLCRNLPPIDPVEDKLARDSSPLGDPHSGNTSSLSSCNPTLSPALVPALIPALALTPIPTKELFKRFMKAYLESNQGSRQPPVEREQTLKAKVLELYYGKSYMDCYHFYQYCKNHFETAGATGANQTLFAAFFLHGSISMCWTQFKHCHWG